jgi:1-acyl-sn-glycerol-3-phosphate acyltransferase
MILLRSLGYYVVLALTIILYGVPLALLGWLMPMNWRHAIGSSWGRANLWWLGALCHLHYRIEGAEHLPDGPAIVMSKHQSSWETIALRGLLRKEQTWVLKRELMWIPVFGWAMAAVQPIAIDRKAGRKAARQIIEEGRERLEQGQTIIIFPEGTRTAPGQRRKYGIGGGMLAEKTGAQVIPIAHNAGVFWHRRSVYKLPGTIRVVVGAPLDVAGLNAAQITRAVEEWIETQQARLPLQPD